MNVAAKHQSKMHSNPPARNADMTTTGVNESVSSQAIRSGINGELNDIPGSRSAQFVSNDYSNGRHTAYDSEFAQPAYSGHGKVQVGTTGAL